MKRDQFFVPIAIHRVSGENLSFGSSFRNAFECFHDKLAQADDVDVFFCNPPFHA